MRTLQYPDDMGSKFRFIAVAAQRCRQLQKGARPRVQSRSKKFTTVAQEEVLAGQVPFFDGPPPLTPDNGGGSAGHEEMVAPE